MRGIPVDGRVPNFEGIPGHKVIPKLNLEPDLGFDVMTLLNLEVRKTGN